MLNKQLLIELQEYVERNLNFLTYSMMESNEKHSIGLEDFIKNKRQPTFNQTLFKLIDKKGTADTEIYKKAGLDRRHFSKIRSNPEYRPRKNTVVALALALELNKKETDKLLSSAGYSLSDSDTFDLVIQFCLEKKIYNVHDVNQALDYFSLKPFMGVLD
ncbi:hypothetical protein [Neobacillus rhizophilus]|uniref:Appr-1-p processing protein n=1 Tax=Neobacillus rhizophilus TaxID=2833579 RepID=A0A942U750_9BACI|nr:hypothetical protein [Neobacillus rhizophilus]MBS4213528.1 hypothetical protein [Neobacillus rhizophilus]MBU8918062.1 hypothetical protein [Bacillus sp. FJAT-29953]